MARIVILGPEGRQEAALLPHNTIGRHPNNTVQVLDRIISKEHCHIDLENGRYVLKDLGSLNGSYVNNERISHRVLAPGDEITLGSTRIIFDPEAVRAQTGPKTVPERHSPPVPAQGPTAPHPSLNAAGQVISPVVNLSGGPTQKQNAQNAPPQPSANAWNVQTGGVLKRPPPPKPGMLNSKVTIAAGVVESHIRTKLAPLKDQNFLQERLIQDVDALRRDYEKLRISYELARSIGGELDGNRVLTKILDAAFQLLAADRGVILLFDDDKQLQPRAVRNRKSDDQNEVLISTTIVEQVLRERTAVLSSDAAVDSRFQGAHSIIMQGIRSSMAVPLLHSNELFGIMLLDSQIATNAFTEKDLQLFQNVANQAAVSIQNSLFAKRLEQEAITRQKFQRLLSPAIAQQVIDGSVEIAKGGENRETTVLFSDIRGFTSMSERSRPELIVDMLNEYFELMVEVIFKYEGTLDKFVGDEIMALFGSPVSHDDDPARAVKTAIEMSDVLAQLNSTRQERGDPPVHIGIGINSGEVVAGYLGSSKALEYTVIGDTVNTGARLCSLAQAGQIIISQNTYDRVSSFVRVVELPATAVKGKAAPLRIFNVTGMR